jgi:hypothetical protein
MSFDYWCHFLETGNNGPQQKKELLVLKKQKTKLSQQNIAAKVEVTRVEKETGKYSKPIW